MATHPATRWLQEHWEQLHDYNNHWVAANSEGVVEHDEKFDAVVDRLRLESVSFETIVLAFVTFDVVQ